jgi:hypothetical protein
MSDTDCRRKMISLRLSDEEYEALKGSYLTYGVRNVSELARLAVQRIMSAPLVPEDACAPKLSELDRRVCALESCVSHLMERQKVMS